MNTTTCSFVLVGALVSLLSTTAFAAVYDLTGAWSYTTSDFWNEGVCEEATAEDGALTIVQDPDEESFVLNVTTGLDCDPTWTCEFDEGFITDELLYTAGASGDTGNMGDYVDVYIEFQPSSAEAASGSYSYSKFASVDSCSFGFDFEMTRFGDVNDDGDGNSDSYFGGSGDPSETSDDSAEPDDCTCRAVGQSQSSVLIKVIAVLMSWWTI